MQTSAIIKATLTLTLLLSSGFGFKYLESNEYNKTLVVIIICLAVIGLSVAWGTLYVSFKK